MELQYLKALYLSNRAINITGKRHCIDLTFKMLLTCQSIAILNARGVSISAKRLEARMQKDKALTVDYNSIRMHLECLVNGGFITSKFIEKEFNGYYIYTPTPKLFTMLKAFNSTLKRMKIN